MNPRLQAFNSDETALAYLAARMNGRKTGLSRDPVAKRLRWKRWRRDWRSVARRWLERVRGGTWYTGGHHVGRLHYGPAIGEERPDRGPLVVIRSEASR